MINNDMLCGLQFPVIAKKTELGKLSTEGKKACSLAKMRLRLKADAFYTTQKRGKRVGKPQKQKRSTTQMLRFGVYCPHADRFLSSETSMHLLNLISTYLRPIN